MTTVLETTAAGPTPARSRRLLRGPAGDPAWVRPALLGLLAVAGALHLWGLSASGWANAYYSAAAQAMAQDWTAFFYGSFDAGNAITVDKPPAALWVMALSVRVFGLSSWSILVPQALMGIATVGVLHAAVRRAAGPAAGLLAGTVMALTPVAVLMFRFNNPDALLVLLLTLAAYALTRSLEQGSARWLALAGVLVGFAFLTKMLQALLVVPAFALAYLVAAPTTLRRRVVHLLGAGLALLVSAGWWVAIVELVPASRRPYVGGSQTDSVWELIWGYNGLGRLTGAEIGSLGPAPGLDRGGLGRLFDSAVGGQVSWLLPAALALLAGGLLVVGRAPRTDVRRAALLLWGGWLLVTALVFSLMAGIFHEYYTVALAPAIGALVGTGGVLVWRHRSALWARALLAATFGGSALWSWVLLGRSADFLPALRWVLLVGGVVAAAGLLVADRIGRAVLAALLSVGLLGSLGGPLSYAVATAATPHVGAIPTAGPPTAPAAGAGPPDGTAQVLPGPGTGGGGSGAVVPFGGPGGGAAPPAAGSGPGGAGPDGEVSDRVVDVLTRNAADHTWVAATVGAGFAAGYQLATGLPVLAIGGFTGTDPAPTLEEFRELVADGRIGWFIGEQPDGGSGDPTTIAGWVAANFSPVTVDGVTLYDLTSG